MTPPPDTFWERLSLILAFSQNTWPFLLNHHRMRETLKPSIRAESYASSLVPVFVLAQMRISTNGTIPAWSIYIKNFDISDVNKHETSFDELWNVYRTLHLVTQPHGPKEGRDRCVIRYLDGDVNTINIFSKGRAGLGLLLPIGSPRVTVSCILAIKIRLPAMASILSQLLQMGALGLTLRFCLFLFRSSLCSLFFVWLHSSCRLANQPVELSAKLVSDLGSPSVINRVWFIRDSARICLGVSQTIIRIMPRLSRRCPLT